MVAIVLGIVISGIMDKIDKSVDVFNDITPKNETTQPAEPEKVKTDATEKAKLKELKDEFVKMVKEKYPTVELSFAIKNLDTGESVIYNDKQMNSASLIKLFILETVYSENAADKYELTDDAKEDLGIMITKSDNDAANRFIDDFGGQNEKRKVEATNIINKTIKAHGYKHTELNRKMHDTTPPEGPSGYNNYTSAADVCEFLEGIYNKTLLKEPFNTETLSLMKKQERRTKIPDKISEKYPDVIVANKTGELSQVENDAALIMSDDFNLVFVVLTDGIPLNEDGTTDYDMKKDVQSTISELGLRLVEFYKENNF